MRRATAREDTGAVSAETALAMPAVALLMALVVAVGTVVVAQVQCVDAARAGARLAARGEEPGRVTQAARAAGPRGATVRVARRASQVSVVVQAQVSFALGGAVSVEVEGRAVAEVEDP